MSLQAIISAQAINIRICRHDVNDNLFERARAIHSGTCDCLLVYPCKLVIERGMQSMLHPNKSLQCWRCFDQGCYRHNHVQKANLGTHDRLTL